MTHTKTAIALILAVAFYKLSFTTADTDIWGHTLFGLDAMRAGKLPSVDPYTYTAAGHPWVNHEWLAEVSTAAVWMVAGGAGLVILKATFAMIVVGLMLWALLREGAEPFRAGFIIVPTVLLLGPGLLTVRPQMFTYLLFAIMLAVMIATEHGNKRLWYTLPVLMALWANLHGGVLAGLGVLGAWAGTRTLGYLAHRAGFLAKAESPTIPLIAFTLSLLGTAANPDGLELIRYLIRTLSDKRPDINEWRSVKLASTEGLAVVAFELLAVVSWLVTRKPRNWYLLAPLLCCLSLPFQAVRHVPLFVTAVVMLSAPHLADLLDRLGPSRAPGKAVSWLLGIVAAVLTVLGILQCRSLPVAAWAEFRYPARMMERLKRTETQGNLACHFEWGEYLMWHLHPRIKVSYDGRRETVYSHELMQKLWAFEFGVPGWEYSLTTPPADFAIVTRDGPTVELLRQHAGWVMVAEDAFAVMFARKDYAGVERLRSVAIPDDIPADGVGTVFPPPSAMRNAP